MKRYRAGRLYFFPAFIPFLELIPWLLSLAGVFIGAIPAIRKSRLFKPAIALALIAVGSYYGIRKYNAISKINDIKAAVNWYTPLNVYPYSPLVVHAQTSEVLFGARDGVVAIFDLKSGDFKRDIKKRKDPVFAAPVFTEHGLLLGEGMHENTDSTLTLHDYETGAVKWTYASGGGHIESELIIQNGVVYFTEGDLGLSAVEIKSGKLLWNAKLGHADIAPLVLKNGKIIALFKSQNGSMIAEIETGTGRLLRKTQLEHDPWGNVHLLGNFYVVSTSTGQITDEDSEKSKAAISWIDARSFELRHVNRFASFVLPEAVVTGDEITYVIRNGNIVRLKDGKIIESKKIAEKVLAYPVACDKQGAQVIVIVDFLGKLKLVHPKTFSVLHEIEIQSWGTSRPVCEAGFVYVATPQSLISMELKW